MSESQFQLGFKKNQSQLELKQQADAKANAEIRVAACVACLAVLRFAEVCFACLACLVLRLVLRLALRLACSACLA